MTHQPMAQDELCAKEMSRSAGTLVKSGVKAFADSFAAFRALPMPVFILSEAKNVIVASDALERLLGWPSPSKQENISPSERPIFNATFESLGVELLLDDPSPSASVTIENILDGLATEFLRESESPSIRSAKQAQPTIQSNNNDDDDGFDPWPEEEWARGPDISVTVKVQRRISGTRPFKARLTARLWTSDGEILFIITISKPLKIRRRGKSVDSEIPGAIKGARKILKLETVKKMKCAMFDCVQMPCFLFSADETVYYPNEAGKRLTGQLDEDYMLEHGYEILKEINIWDEHYQRKLDVSEFPGIQLVRQRKSFRDRRYGYFDPQTGERLRLDLSGDCLFDEYTGDFLGGIMWCSDVTDYTKVIAQQAREIDRGFENILDNMPNMMFTAHPIQKDGIADYFSKQWYEYTGAPQGRSTTEIWQDSIHPDDMEKLWSGWLSAITEEREFNHEVRYKRHDGAFRWHMIRAVPKRGLNGLVHRYYGTIVDIHDLVVKRREAALRTQQMISVLSHAEVSLFGFDNQFAVILLEGSIHWGDDVKVTPEMKQAFMGRSFTNIVAKSTLRDEEGVCCFTQHVNDVLDGKSDMSIFEHKIKNKWYRTRVIPDTEQNEKGEINIRGALGLSIDITDMKARIALEMERQHLMVKENSAQEANRLKTQFLANVSHELRTPIAGILGMTDLLLETPLEDEQKEYARGVQQSADSLLTIVNDILDFSKIESGRFDIEEIPFHLSSVLDDLTKLMKYAAQRKGLTLNYVSSLNQTEYVIGDPGRIRQILVNLLTNAIKFTSKGGINFSVEIQGGEDAVNCHFMVQDTGIGIEPAIMKKLFRPFSQGDSSTARLFGGTGLGLTICKELANLMHGKVSLTSSPGVGTKAMFSLPLRKTLNRRVSRDTYSSDIFRNQILEARKSVELELEMSLRPLRKQSPSLESTGAVDVLCQLSQPMRELNQVLIVEDNAINQNIVSKLVNKLGFPVKAVWNGKECLEYLRQTNESNPRPNVILMDCQMPVMDGYEATHELRNNPTYMDEFKNVPIIALTASAIVGDREKCKAAGMDDYITKPVTKQDLERVLVKWATRRDLPEL